MIKEITISVPRYVAKFLASAPDYELLTDTVNSPKKFRIAKKSELGQIIAGLARSEPIYKEPEAPKVAPGSTLITLRYTCKKKAYNVPDTRYQALTEILVENFRASLIREVSAIQSLTGEPEYSWIIRKFLDRHGVVIDESQEKDIEWDTAKKIYRDHLARIDKKNVRFRQLSQPLLSQLSAFCPD